VQNSRAGDSLLAVLQPSLAVSGCFPSWIREDQEWVKLVLVSCQDLFSSAVLQSVRNRFLGALLRFASAEEVLTSRAVFLGPEQSPRHQRQDFGSRRVGWGYAFRVGPGWRVGEAPLRTPSREGNLRHNPPNRTGPVRAQVKAHTRHLQCAFVLSAVSSGQLQGCFSACTSAGAHPPAKLGCGEGRVLAAWQPGQSPLLHPKGAADSVPQPWLRCHGALVFFPPGTFWPGADAWGAGWRRGAWRSGAEGRACRWHKCSVLTASCRAW